MKKSPTLPSCVLGVCFWLGCSSDGQPVGASNPPSSVAGQSGSSGSVAGNAAGSGNAGSAPSLGGSRNVSGASSGGGTGTTTALAGNGPVGDGPKGSFVHPGLLNTKAELAKIVSDLNAGEPLRTAGFAKLREHLEVGHKIPAPNSITIDVEPYVSRVPHAHEAMSYNGNQWHWSVAGTPAQDLMLDSQAAYGLTLAWALTGNAAFAEKAVKLIDAWTSTLKTYDDNAGFPLSFLWPTMLYASELLRSGYTGYGADAQQRFTNITRTDIFPRAIDTTQKNNIKMLAVGFRLQAAVYLDDQTELDGAVADWKDWMPRYISSDPIPHVTEICRDLQHAMLGVMPLVASAEVAHHQGIDLYSYSNNLLYGGVDHLAQLVHGDDASFKTLCPSETAPETEWEQMMYFWEMAYNQYHNRAQLPGTGILRLLEDGASATLYSGVKIRPEGYMRMGYGTLTHTNLAP